MHLFSFATSMAPLADSKHIVDKISSSMIVPPSLLHAVFSIFQYVPLGLNGGMYYLLEKILFVGLFIQAILFTGQKKKKFEKNHYILRD
jgi:hypothetical protein